MRDGFLDLAAQACPAGMGVMMWMMGTALLVPAAGAGPVRSPRAGGIRCGPVSENAPDGAPPRLHDLEAEVMVEMWAGGEATVRSVMDSLNARVDKQRKYTTIMTIMARLHRKGLLLRRREGKTDIYVPVLTREQYHEARAQEEVGALVNEYGDLALMHFAKQMAELDPKRREQLRRLARK
jgi:predicted transcriptional regulator